MQNTYGCITHLELVGKVFKDKKKQTPNTQETTKQQRKNTQHTKSFLFSHLHMTPLMHPSFP
jgi:hypothetical protein